LTAALDPQRTLRELKELRALTSDENGAQRVAFTPIWAKARDWLRQKLEELFLKIHRDEAGNVWATLAGESDQALVIGGHIDSVPNGGWLDGSLNLLAGLEILRRIKTQYSGKPPVSVRLVDWADEEGARFGMSLFGSSACSGHINLAETRRLQDKDGIALIDALAEHGIDFERLKDSGRELQNAEAYIELHIEQGPILLDLDLALGAVLGTFGVERHAITFRGQAAHSGSTPMNRRRDAFLAAAKMSPESYRIANHHGGVCTIGTCSTLPGIATSVVAECRITLDQRHLDPAALARMLEEAKHSSDRFAEEGDVSVSWERLMRIEPIPFDSELLALCDEAIRETCGAVYCLPSGPLHDAAEVARAGIPTAMMFVQSLYGISHNKIEDTKEEHIEAAVIAFDKLAEKAMQLMVRPGRSTDAERNS
jgi:beta-ureidopropionase / N-carbamoyl-L-amino-acid hydrolase